MTSIEQRELPSSDGPPGLLVGPGRKAREVARVLTVLAATRSEGGAVDEPRPGRVRSFRDLEDLSLVELRARLAGFESEETADPLGRTAEADFEGAESIGRDGLGVERTGSLLLEVAEVASEDIGFVRRFLERRAGWSLLLLADDPTTALAQALLGLPRARWMPWPPDLDQLARLLFGERSVPRAASPLASVPADPPLDALPPASRDATSGDGTSGDATSGDATSSQAEPPIEESAGEESAAEESESPAWSVRLPEDPPAPDGEPGAAEPASADATELGALVEELLAVDSLGSADAPRYLFRCDGESLVVAERERLSACVDNLLGLARKVSGAGGVVSVVVGALNGAEDVLLRIDFPPGDLGDTRIEELLRRAEAAGPDSDDPFGQALAGAAWAANELRSLDAEPSLVTLEDGRLRLAVVFPSS